MNTNATFTACCLASSEYLSKNTYRVTRIKVKIKTMFSVKKGYSTFEFVSGKITKKAKTMVNTNIRSSKTRVY